MKLEKPLYSQEDFLTPETVEILKNRVEMAVVDLVLENREMLKKADQIKKEDLREMLKAKLGVIQFKADSLKRPLEEGAELDVSLN